MTRIFRDRPVAPSHRSPGPLAEFIERLEDRTVPAAFDYTADTITITLTATGTTAESVTVTNNGTDIVASDGSNGIVQSVGAVSRIVVTDTGGSTAQTLTFTGTHTIALRDGLSSTGVEFVAFNAAIDAGASGAIDVTAPASISVSANLTTNDGPLTLSANQQTTPTTGAFVGVDVNGATARATGTGTITVLGRGGTDTAGSQHGVLVRGAGAIVGGLSGLVTVQGIGGESSGHRNYGVYLSDAGTQVTSDGGAVSVTGTGGGTGLSSSNFGVRVVSGAITANGMGAITV